MICDTCKAAGELQKNHRSNPTPEVENVIRGLYDQCRGCPCAKQIDWNYVIKQPT